MCQNSESNCCQDYSLQTANTGIAIASTANPNLNGTGTLVTVVTAGQLGAIVKSVIIKAIAPVKTGMVRLFVQRQNPTLSVLYREVPIPITPVLNSTPTPTPVLSTFETILLGDIKLEAGYSLVATTQTGDAFVIVAESLDWSYPAQLPTDCCNFKQVSAVTGLNIVSTANTNLDGSGTIVPIFTAAAGPASNGSCLKTLTIKALQSTSINGMIRLFISADGGNTYNLMQEIPVPETTQSAYEPSYKQIAVLNYHLQAGYIIGASTQNNESFGLTIEAEEWSYPI